MKKNVLKDSATKVACSMLNLKRASNGKSYTPDATLHIEGTGTIALASSVIDVMY